MARGVPMPPDGGYWPGYGAIPAFVSVFIGLGDVHVRAESAQVTAAASSSVVPATEKPLGGNPVWLVPLGALSETIARPLFSPSRRPPSPPAVAAPYVPPAKPPPPAQPDHPRLTLLGTIVGRSEAIAIFLDEASQTVIRLKVGQARGGWLLTSIDARVAKFQKDRQLATVALRPLQTKAAEQMAHVDAAAAASAALTVDRSDVDRVFSAITMPAMSALPAASQTKEPVRRTPREL